MTTLAFFYQTVKLESGEKGEAAMEITMTNAYADTVLEDFDDLHGDGTGRMWNAIMSVIENAEALKGRFMTGRIYAVQRKEKHI